MWSENKTFEVSWFNVFVWKYIYIYYPKEDTSDGVNITSQLLMLTLFNLWPQGIITNPLVTNKAQAFTISTSWTKPLNLLFVIFPLISQQLLCCKAVFVCGCKSAYPASSDKPHMFWWHLFVFPLCWSNEGPSVVSTGPAGLKDLALLWLRVTCWGLPTGIIKHCTTPVLHLNEP